VPGLGDAGVGEVATQVGGQPVGEHAEALAPERLVRRVDADALDERHPRHPGVVDEGVDQRGEAGAQPLGHGPGAGRRAGGRRAPDVGPGGERPGHHPAADGRQQRGPVLELLVEVAGADAGPAAHVLDRRRREPPGAEQVEAGGEHGVAPVLPALGQRAPLDAALGPGALPVGRRGLGERRSSHRRRCTSSGGGVPSRAGRCGHPPASSQAARRCAASDAGVDEAFSPLVDGMT
jgi:hypothetical protein